MPTFANYPSALPYLDELHKEDLLAELVASLKGQRTRRIRTKQETPKHPFMDAFTSASDLTLGYKDDISRFSSSDPCLDLYYASHRVTRDRDLRRMLENAWAVDADLTLHIIFYIRSIHRGQSLTAPFMSAFSWLLQYHPRTALANLHVLVDGTVRTDAALKAQEREEYFRIKAEKEGREYKRRDYGQLLERRDFKSHGCWKDLCTILTIYAQGELRGPSGAIYKALKWPKTAKSHKSYIAFDKREKRFQKRKAMDPEEARKDAEIYIKKRDELNAKIQAEAKKTQEQIRKERNRRVTKLLQADPLYRALHFTIARLFANQLKVDMAQLQKNKDAIEQGVLKGRHALGFNLSLAGKWAPSLYQSHDKHTFLATSIAELLFPPEKHQDDGESREHYLNKIRDLYRKQYLVPLRDALDLIEHYTLQDKWDKVDFTHVPAVCFRKNLCQFFKYAPDAVKGYLDDVTFGKQKSKNEENALRQKKTGIPAFPRRTKISGVTMTPSKLADLVTDSKIPKKLKETIKNAPELWIQYKEVKENLVNAQWKALIESLRSTSQLKSNGSRKQVKLEECVPVCYLPAAMQKAKDPTSIYATIGLSLLVANLTKPPFNGIIITYSRAPTIFKVDTSLPFDQQIAQVKARSNLKLNSHFKGTFSDVLLAFATENKVKPEDMIKRLFVFTTSERSFGEAKVECDRRTHDKTEKVDKFETAFDLIRRRYHEAGYDVPEIVWWNVFEGDKMYDLDAPVSKDDAGVKMLAGYSANMLKTFLDGGDIDEDKAKQETPLDFAKKAVYHESFKDLVVVD
ncbi:hypothetical protein CU097_010674 [Rhizopus azygosporus]|uniref:Uncharacterized protein n=1 Tax=Rhizopus azygosporus TaxID=86630 RepID=A0A367K8D9_RHIAZ|nr:hypothetical protein G6F69_004426 [Rhizopus microsporus]KAG1232471.1 hypothetical protein G6F67_004989 [Rhizopus microsporus]RCH98101.1 hypothetical protein CU097_010674 [Rhizopus azygosporus]